MWPAISVFTESDPFWRPLSFFGGVVVHILALWYVFEPVAGLPKEDTLKLFSGASKDPNTKKKYTPLHLAAQTGHETVVRLLLESGENISGTYVGKFISHLLNTMHENGYCAFWPHRSSGNFSIAMSVFSEPVVSWQRCTLLWLHLCPFFNFLVRSTTSSIFTERNKF